MAEETIAEALKSPDLGTEERQDAAKAAVKAAPIDDKQDIAMAAVDALPTAAREELVAGLVPDAVTDVLKNAEDGSAVRQDAAKAAVTSAPVEEKHDIALAAVDALPTAARQELIDSLMPQDSGDRMTVYLAGFVLAGVLSLGLATIALIAERSGDGSSGVATAAIAAALSLPSAIIGGLLGAMAPKK